MKRVLCVWLPNWPLQRLCAERPELKGRPLVLYRQQPRRGAVVACCSAEAAASGIRPGMPLAEARTLASNQSSVVSRQVSTPSSFVIRPSSFPPSSFILQPSSFPLDRAALSTLAAWCQQFSPTVGLEDAAQPEALLLDVTGAAERLGGEAALVEQVATAFAARGLVAHLGLGETVGAAWARAHFAGSGECIARSGEPSANSVQCSVFSVQSPTESSSLIPPTSSLSSSFSLSSLRLPPDTLALLAELGLSSLAELQALPRAGLAARFGPELLARIDQAVGERAEVIQAERCESPLQAEWNFEAPTTNQQMVEAVLDPLLAQILSQLEPRRAGVTELECLLCLEQGEPLRLRIGLFRPSGSVRHVRELIQLQFEQVRSLPPVAAVRMQVMAWQLLECHQRELPFGDRSAQGSAAPPAADEEQRELAALVDRLASRLGRDAVLRARPQAETQPEHACRYESWLDLRPRRPPARGKKAGKPKASRDRKAPDDVAVVHGLSPASQSSSEGSLTTSATEKSPVRPLRLVRTPVAMDVLSIAPDGPPRTFRLAGREHIVRRYLGPERIETGWWRRQSARRDYYRVENQHGEWLWLFRRLRDGRWFWQGVFE